MLLHLRRERRLIAYLCLHALLFLGLYQVGYTPTEWAYFSERASQLGESPLSAARQAEGSVAFVKAYYRTDSDERLYREYANLALHGHADIAYIAAKQYSKVSAVPLGRAVPYRDVRVEYPPLALLLGVIPPRLISGDTYFAYRFALGAWLFLLHSLGLGCGLFLLRVRGFDAASEQRFLGASLAFCLLLGNIVATRLDALVALFLLGGVLLIERSLRVHGKDAQRAASWVGVLAALGVLTKVVPGLLIPTALVVFHGSGRVDRRRLMLAALVSGGGVLVALHGLFWLCFGDGYLATFGYHAQRGLQLESSYASVLLLAHLFGFPVELDLGFGSSNLASALSPVLAAVSPCVLLVAILTVMGLALRSRVIQPLPLVCALTLWFVVASKVFSPQYLIWASPCVLLLGASTRSRNLTLLWLLIAALSQVLYPRAYAALKHFSSPLVVVLLVRNLLVLLVAVLVTRLTLEVHQLRTRADSA